ncbi:MAG: hypothetical protein HZA04_00520, partial [Nitrospinae bacterium]|nr:hypothetical protein [Nitrospinota bacterium]
MRGQVSFILPTLFLGIALSFPLLAAGGEPSLLDHWKRPAKADGGHFSLHPEKFGSCHATQYESWRGSRHAQAVGIKVAGYGGGEVSPARSVFRTLGYLVSALFFFLGFLWPVFDR